MAPVDDALDRLLAIVEAAEKEGRWHLSGRDVINITHAAMTVRSALEQLREERDAYRIEGDHGHDDYEDAEDIIRQIAEKRPNQSFDPWASGLCQEFLDRPRRSRATIATIRDRAEAAEAEVRQLREERDGWEKIAESRALYAHKQAARMGAHASAPQPTPVSGVPLAATGKASEGAEDGTGIDTRYRGRAEAAEADLERLRRHPDAWSQRAFDQQKARAEAAEAEVRRLTEGLREWCDADAGSHPGFIAIADVRALLAGSEAVNCDKCGHAAHEPGRCPANVGTGYFGPVLCRCGADGGGAK